MRTGQRRRDATSATTVSGGASSLLFVALLALWCTTCQGCNTENYYVEEANNPLGPSRCRASSNGCDCDGLRTCSFWGYCQGVARGVSQSDTALPPPPLAPGTTSGGTTATLPSPAQQPADGPRDQLPAGSVNGGDGSKGIGSGGVRNWIIIPIIIFGIVFGVLAFIFAFCACRRITRWRLRQDTEAPFQQQQPAAMWTAFSAPQHRFFAGRSKNPVNSKHPVNTIPPLTPRHSGALAPISPHPSGAFIPISPKPSHVLNNTASQMQHGGGAYVPGQEWVQHRKTMQDVNLLPQPPYLQPPPPGPPLLEPLQPLAAAVPSVMVSCDSASVGASSKLASNGGYALQLEVLPPNRQDGSATHIPPQEAVPRSSGSPPALGNMQAVVSSPSPPPRQPSLLPASSTPPQVQHQQYQQQQCRPAHEPTDSSFFGDSRRRS